jgi:hypothetical protein
VRIRRFFILNLLIILTSSFLLAGCTHTKKTTIITIDTTELSMQDFLYEIFQVEVDGNHLEDYYKKNLGYSYWDSVYKGTTMRELAKNAIIAGVVMHQILMDQAEKNGLTLTKTEVLADQTIVEDIYKDNSSEALNNVGLTEDILQKSIDKITLADKYKKQLCKDFDIDEDAIRSSIKRNDYSSEESYEKAVSDAIAYDTDKQFEPAYQKIKADYKITINFDYWDGITIGSVFDFHEND